MTKIAATEEKILKTSNEPVKLDQSLVQFEQIQVKRKSWSEKLLCHLLKIHSGKWVYTREGSCHQMKICTRCGTTKVRTKHQREWVYITEVTKKIPKIVQSICPQCGIKFPGPYLLTWHLEQVHRFGLNKSNGSAICEQEQVCRRCGEISPGHRIQHAWGNTYSIDSNTDAHECIRCGHAESWSTSYDD